MMVSLLGSVQAVQDGQVREVNGLRRKAVLAALALHRGEIVSTDWLIAAVWGDGSDAPPVALNTLQSHISHLRRVLGGARIVARPPGYMLDLPPGSVDVEVAEGLIKEGVRLADPAARAERLRAALRQWRGRPLADVAGIPWLEEQAERLDQLQLSAARALAEARLALGEHEQVIPELSRLARDHPLDEQLQGHLVLALYRAGRQADALAAVRHVRHTLSDELGIDLSAPLRELETAILRQDDRLHHHPAEPPTGRRAVPAARANGPEPAAASLGGAFAGVLTGTFAGPLGAAAIVGRAAELGLLRGAVERATTGDGSSVFIIGEPGIGKTRLAAEAARLAAGQGLTVLRGRAADPAVAYRPLGEALLSGLRRHGLPPIPALRPYLGALALLVPELRAAAGPVGDAGESLVVLAEAVLRLILAFDPRHGCLLVLDDLHDADPGTLAVLEYLTDNAVGHRLLVVGTARGGPGPAAELIRAARRRGVAAVVEPRRLDDDAVARLAAACLGRESAGPDGLGDLDDPHGLEYVPAELLEHLRRCADGVPLHVEELVAGLAADGVLHREGLRWTIAGPLAERLPESLVATLAGRCDRLHPRTGALLRAAALFGQDFPAAVAAAAAGLAPAELPARLHEAIDAQLILGADEQGWYAFRHVLTAEALRARLLPMERAAVARAAALALEPAGEERARPVNGRLWQLAGEPHRAAAHLGTAGRSAARRGALPAAVALLEAALTLLDDAPAGDLFAEVGAALVDAYAEVGRAGDAYRIGDRLGPGAEPRRRAVLRLRLARVAATTGDWSRGLTDVAESRRLLGAVTDPATAVRLDAVEAELIFGEAAEPAGPRVIDLPPEAVTEGWANQPTEPAATVLSAEVVATGWTSVAPARRAVARRLAERALAGAEAAGQPDVACSALETLGRHARLSDLETANVLYERGLAVATAHDLGTWRVTLLFHLGVNDGIRDGTPDRLLDALAAASRSGAVITAHDIEVELALVRVCRAEYAAAEAIIERCAEIAARLGLDHGARLVLGQRAILAAHRGDRETMRRRRDEFHAAGGGGDDYAAAVDGLGVAVGELLHEEPGAAWTASVEVDRLQEHRPASFVSLASGLFLLLAALRGEPAGTLRAARAAAEQGQARWNLQFAALADAVTGPAADADAAVRRFLALSDPFPLARHLGLRLVAPDAIDRGWGEPAAWLRSAEGYFHDRAPAVARACRNLLRTAGTPVPQHRAGSSALPDAARRHGVTVREYEVLELVAARLGNREIGGRLFLSPRTVENHVAALLAKTGAADRAGLAAWHGALQRDVSGGGESA